MNILYLTNHLNIGGISSYVFSLAAVLKTKGHNIYIATSEGELLVKLCEKGVNYIPIPIKTKCEISLKIIFSLVKLSFVLKDKNIDIVHSNSRTTQVLGRLLSRNIGAGYVSTCHGFFKTRISRRILPCWGNKVIAVSEQVREHLINDFKVKEGDIRVVNNGIDVEKFRRQKTEDRRQKKKEFGLPGNGPVIGIIARLSEVKGHRYLVCAMKEVIKSFPQAQLLIAGEGRIYDDLRSLTNKSGIEKNVFFVPQICDTRECLSVMDVFVMPSLEEGLGLALMEAMAYGVPVIGSDVGGIKSLIQNGHNGLLVKPRDIQGLSYAILDLLNNRAKAMSFAEKAGLFISENFSQEKMAVQTEEVYRECARY